MSCKHSFKPSAVSQAAASHFMVISSSCRAVSAHLLIAWLLRPRALCGSAVPPRSQHRLTGFDLVQHMAVAGLTRDNVASHLQKHRMHMKRAAQGPAASQLSGQVSGGRPSEACPERATASSGTVASRPAQRCSTVRSLVFTFVLPCTSTLCACPQPDVWFSVMSCTTQVLYMTHSRHSV